VRKKGGKKSVANEKPGFQLSRKERTRSEGGLNAWPPTGSHRRKQKRVEFGAYYACGRGNPTFFCQSGPDVTSENIQRSKLYEGKWRARKGFRGRLKDLTNAGW